MKMDAIPRPLGATFLHLGLISQDQLDIALHEQRRGGGLLGQQLVQLGFISEAVLRDALADALAQSSVDLATQLPDPEALALIPRDVASRLKLIPLSYDAARRHLLIATGNSHDSEARDQVLNFLPVGTRIETCLAGQSEIARAIDQLYGHTLSIDGILHEIETGTRDGHRTGATRGEYAQPVVRLIDALLADAVKRGASDIHFEPEAGFLRIRYRLDGLLRQIRVLRVLDRHRGIVPLDELGLAPAAFEQLKRMIYRPEGLILVTGPTGSGKTTTLYSILNHLNTEHVNIMTLEAPVEYPLAMIRQTAVADAARLDFANGVKAMLRQDPDIILVGEIRDTDTARMALQAAMTGHQVYSTLHTNSAVGTIPRLLDIGIQPDILAGNLIGVIAQRLVRRLCPTCRETHPASEPEMELLGLSPDQPRPLLHHATGCTHCEFQGYRGRLAIIELLRLNPDLDELIARRASPRPAPRDPRQRAPARLCQPCRRRHPAGPRRQHHRRGTGPDGRLKRSQPGMTDFAHRALDPRGRRVRGRLQATDLADLELRLRNLDLDLLHGKPVGTTPWARRQGPVSRRELIKLCFHLEQFLRAGVPILESLNDLRDSIHHPLFRQVINDTVRSIEGGLTLSEALACHPRVFDPVFCNLIRAGELSGCLPEILDTLSTALKREAELASHSRRLAIYPAIVITVILAALGVALLFVVPELARLFHSTGRPLPWQTRQLIAVAGLLAD
ncbi:ATPase, T2SS/T4P/T4SS family [Zoogloea sp.]|uniref:ATPase, T2SS/T4P/T4SS family n=1 Tax=Zoogloea sp. TaxID=49181 RepID=UPI0035B3B8D0